MKNKFIVVDLNAESVKEMVFRNEDGSVFLFDTEKRASNLCGMYEFDNVWVCELKYNYVDEEMLNLHFPQDG